MAINTTSQILNDGARNLVMQLTGIADGPGQEVNVVKVDVSTLNPPCASVMVKRIEHAISGGLVDLAWDADVPIIFASLSAQGIFYFPRVAGVPNNVDPPRNGNILLSTRGFDLDASYTLTLSMIKKY